MEPINYPPHFRPQLMEPILAPSEIVGIDIKLEELIFPMYASIKFNGVRACLLRSTFYSRNIKPLNICESILYQLQPIVDYADEHKLVFDGELHAYSDNTVGGMLSMLAGNKAVPYDFKYKVFGIYTYKQWNGGEPIFMKDMQQNEHWAKLSNATPCPQLELVVQDYLETKEDLEEMAATVQLNSLVEGLMLASPSLVMGHGRQNAKMLKFLKMKFYSDAIDGQIVGMSARQEHIEKNTEVDPILGKAVRSRRQEDMYTTDIGGCLIVKLENGELVNVPFPKGSSLQMRAMYYKNFRKGGSLDLYKKWLQFKKLSAGEKDKPVAIKCVEFRDSKGDLI